VCGVCVLNTQIIILCTIYVLCLIYDCSVHKLCIPLSVVELKSTFCISVII